MGFLAAGAQGVAHFTLGQLTSGFAEQASIYYQIDLLPRWCSVGFRRARHFELDLAAEAHDCELTHRVVARLPFARDSSYPFPKNDAPSKSDRLEVRSLDLPNWRERA